MMPRRVTPSLSVTTSVDRRGPPSMPRAELGIHGLNRYAVNCLEMSRKRGVHAARNRPSEDGKCWQRIELGIHGLKSWGRNWWRKVRETRSPFSDWHGSNAGHSSGVAQGQRSLNRCSGRDFQHEVFAPTATAAFHSQTVAAGMLLQQRSIRRVLSARPPSCCMTRPRAWSRTSILNRFASLLAGG